MRTYGWGVWVMAAMLGAGGCAVDAGESVGASEARLDTTNVQLGRGYDRVRDEAAAACIDFDGASVFPPGTAGQTVDFSVEPIEASNQLWQRIGMTAAASVRWQAAGNGDAKTAFFHNHPLNPTSVYLLVATRVTNASPSVDNARLKP